MREPAGGVVDGEGYRVQIAAHERRAGARLRMPVGGKLALPLNGVATETCFLDDG